MNFSFSYRLLGAPSIFTSHLKAIFGLKDYFERENFSYSLSLLCAWSTSTVTPAGGSLIIAMSSFWRRFCKQEGNSHWWNVRLTTRLISTCHRTESSQCLAADPHGLDEAVFAALWALALASLLDKCDTKNLLNTGILGNGSTRQGRAGWDVSLEPLTKRAASTHLLREPLLITTSSFSLFHAPFIHLLTSAYEGLDAILKIWFYWLSMISATPIFIIMIRVSSLK